MYTSKLACPSPESFGSEWPIAQLMMLGIVLSQQHCQMKRTTTTEEAVRVGNELSDRSDVEKGEGDTHLSGYILGEMCDLIMDILEEGKRDPAPHFHDGGIAGTM